MTHEKYVIARNPGTIRNGRCSNLVDSVHVVVKGGSVAVVSVCDEQVGMDHLVEQSPHKVLPGTQLEQGLAQPEKSTP